MLEEQESAQDTSIRKQDEYLPLKKYIPNYLNNQMLI